MGHPLDRREFLQAAAAAAAYSLSACTGRREPELLFLTIAERRTLGALCERIVPADDFPGAVEAGGVDFIDRQLVGHYTDYQPLYRLGLEGVDDAATEMAGAALWRVAGDRQIEVLRALESNQVRGSAWQAVSPATFFQVVVAHTMYGYYGDPRHGGNRDGVSWTMLGLPYPPVRGRDQYSLPGRPAADPAQEPDR